MFDESNATVVSPSTVAARGAPLRGGSDQPVVIRVHLSDDKWFLFRSPQRVLAARTPGDVAPLLTAAERMAREEQAYVIGFVTYEAGAAFQLRTRHEQSQVPLAWCAVFSAASAERTGPPVRGGPYTLGACTPSQTRQQYAEAVATIKSHLAAGDSYQVNHTFRMSASFAGDAASLFADLVERQRGQYAVLVQTGAWTVASVSPELFFSRDGGIIVMQPMKGTAPRGRTVAEDADMRERLRQSDKERAENVMIVDMVRNDLGRVAEPGSVAVPELFRQERYPTLWQMTSRVTARSSRSLTELFAALHPCASVTGAPKVRTMEIIETLEAEPRGVYTGAIGFVAPDGTARFSVGIRTAWIDHVRGTLDFGVGSGIVWDSDADREYDECLLKAQVLAPPGEPFDLLETLRWTPDEGFRRLDRHLARMAESAGYFEYRFDRTRVEDELHRGVAGLRDVRRVRLLVSADGQVRVEHVPFVTASTVRLSLAVEPVDVSSVWLFHKTTRRDTYNRARAAAGPGVDDVVLWNRQGEVTETTTCNIVVESADGLITPPLSSGLLPGTMRAALLDDGRLREAPVSIAMLRRAGWCWVVNSLHGWRRGVLS